MDLFCWRRKLMGKHESLLDMCNRYLEDCKEEKTEKLNTFRSFLAQEIININRHKIFDISDCMWNVQGSAHPNLLEYNKKIDEAADILRKENERLFEIVHDIENEENNRKESKK